MSSVRTVLVIDDDEDFRASIGAFPESEGYRVVRARTGREGLAKPKECEPDAILLDIIMETMTEGCGVAFSIKHQPENEAFQDVPIIMLSSVHESPDEHSSRAADTERVSPDRYLSKPVDLDVLLKTLAQTLQHA